MPSLLQKASLQESQALKEREEVLSPPSVEEDQDRDHLGQLVTHKSTASDGVQLPGAEGAGRCVVMPLSITFERSWRTGEVSED